MPPKERLLSTAFGVDNAPRFILQLRGAGVISRLLGGNLTFRSIDSR